MNLPGPEDSTTELPVVVGAAQPESADPARVPPPRRGLQRRDLIAITVAVGLLLVAGVGYAITGRRAPAAAAQLTISPPVSVGSPSAGARKAPLRPGKDTLVLGDSLGLTVYPWLADLLPDRYVSYTAQVGSSTGWALTQLREATRSQLPRVVLVSAGTNDLSAEQFRSDATELLRLLGPNRCVAWADVVRPAPTPGSNLVPAFELNAVLDQLATDNKNLRLVKWTDAVAQNPSLLSGDGIHPTRDGAQARAQAFAAAATACSPLDPNAPTAKQQYLPNSVFWGPVAGGNRDSGSNLTSTGEAVPAPPRRSSTPSPTSTRSHKPSAKPSTKPSRTEEPSASPTRSEKPEPTQEPTSSATATSSAKPNPAAS